MEEMKHCPICGGDLVRPVGVYVRRGSVLHAITARGYELRPVYFEESAHIRGVVIIREFLGECGHRWIEREQFHKGNTLQERQRINASFGPTAVIWRD